MHRLSGFLIGRAILSLCSSQCSEMRRQWVQCGETGPAPETLQNIPLRDRWLAGGMVAGKQAKQQTTTPALHNSYREKKKNPFWKGINPCHIIPVISDNSASICEHKKRLDYAISGELLCWFYYSIWDNFTGISAHFTVANHKHCNECYACCNVKTLLFSAGFSL